MTSHAGLLTYRELEDAFKRKRLCCTRTIQNRRRLRAKSEMGKSMVEYDTETGRMSKFAGAIRTLVKLCEVNDGREELGGQPGSSGHAGCPRLGDKPYNIRSS